MYIAGIDESGRGPLAGPMVIGCVMCNKKALHKLRGIKECKQLLPKKREEWFEKLKNDSDFTIVAVFLSHSVIDKKGISWATREGVKKALKKMTLKPDQVLLDGSLYAPEEYSQKTIIKGDIKVPLIAAASIVAKVKRDALMAKYDLKYPKYGFLQHKGYGTRLHYKMLKKYGPSFIHRLTFISNMIKYR